MATRQNSSKNHDEQIKSIKKSINEYHQEIQKLKQQYYLHEGCLQNIIQKFPNVNSLYLKQVFIAELIRVQKHDNKFQLIFDKSLQDGLRDLTGWGYAWLYILTSKIHISKHKILYSQVRRAQDQSFKLEPTLNYNTNYLSSQINQDAVNKYTYSFLHDYNNDMEIVDLIQLVILVKIEKQFSNIVEISTIKQSDDNILKDRNTSIIDFKVYHVTAESKTHFTDVQKQ